MRYSIQGFLMKKNISFLLILLLFYACSPRKNTFLSRQYQGFTTYYNTLFNSKDALETELTKRKDAYQDNFYEGFIPIFKTEAQAEEILSLPSTPQANPQGASLFTGNAPSTSQSQAGNNKGATILEISEAKAQKAITNHSMEFNGVQRNKRMFEAHLLLAKARMYQGEYLKALDALNYLFAYMSHDKHIDLAKVYEGHLYAKMKNYARANEIFTSLKNQPKLKKKYQKLLSIYHSEMLLHWGKKEEALENLSLAFELNKNHEIRGRIAFLRGQILSSLGKNKEALSAFVTAYKYANNFGFEVRTQIEIAKNFNPDLSDYTTVKNYLLDNSKKGIYHSRLNEFYYALGILARKANKPKEAQEYFHKALEEDLSDPQLRGLTYYEIGKHYYYKNDYLAAGVYYDSAITSMTYQPQIEKLTNLSENIKKVAANYYLMKKNDSILHLTRLSESELKTFFGKYIAQLKKKEEKLAKARAEAQKSEIEFASFSLGSNTTQPRTGGLFGSSNANQFYFENATTVAKGTSDFRQIWGNRSLADNWRFSAHTASIEDLKNEAMGKTQVRNPRRFEVAYYTEQIPRDTHVLAALKKDRDTAQLGLGIMYNRFFDNRQLATETLYNLIDRKPEKEVELKALYAIFSMNYETHPKDAQRAKDIILQSYPYTPYAEFVKNPKSNSFTKSSDKVQSAYIEAYDLYTQGKYEASQKIIEEAIKKYPENILIPKFYLLQAYNTGKTAGKEIMILQLNQIALNYPKTEEGQKAKEMLQYLKSGLKPVLTAPSPTAPRPATNLSPQPAPTLPPQQQENRNLHPVPQSDKKGPPKLPPNRKNLFR